MKTNHVDEIEYTVSFDLQYHFDLGRKFCKNFNILNFNTLFILW